MVIALVGESPSLCLLREAGNDGKTWYSYVNDVSMSHLTDNIDNIDPDAQEVRFEIW